MYGFSQQIFMQLYFSSAKCTIYDIIHQDKVSMRVADDPWGWGVTHRSPLKACRTDDQASLPWCSNNLYLLCVICNC